MPAVKPPAPPYVGPANRYSPGGNKPIDRLVEHCTVSPCVPGGARNIARYFRTTERPASAHYVTDPSESVQVVYDSDTAYHAPPNPHSIGRELCCTLAGEGKGHWRRPDHKAMLAIAAREDAQLCLAYDIPIRWVGPRGLRKGKRGITDHDDVGDAWKQTTHWDCGPYFPKRKYVRMVRREAKRIQAGLPTEPTPKADQPTQAEIRRQQREAAIARRKRRRGIASGRIDANRVERAKALLRLAYNLSRQKGWDDRADVLREALIDLRALAKGK